MSSEGCGRKSNLPTRVWDRPLIDDELVTIGRSTSIGAKQREHVIPCVMIVRACHEMLTRDASDEDIAAFISQHLKIVHVTPEEARRLDSVNAVGMRQSMPANWQFGDDPYARLRAAGIEWEPIEAADAENA
ncbi:hypothetical protein [Brevundimonas sp.]|uniref:hypothetical protein n=1 Tax=Brevundimonas sp. TaxID=1871086 RepID=UPI001DB3FB11|nr:hypothetical protein [Brevundimonas sp.]MBL0947065.1 hypothetical protein [Brevundimonas sp.]